MSVSVLGAFLAFFPIAVGTLRGLQSPPAGVARADGQLRRRRGGSTLFKLRFPAAVPYLVPALQAGGAAGAVVGVVVAEISTGLRGGIGRLIIEYVGRPPAIRPRSTPPCSAPPCLGLVDGRARGRASTRC